MLIVICGMHRSGSTLVAQLVQGLLAEQPLPVTVSENGLGETVADMQARAADPQQIWLVKVHQQAKRFRDGLPDEGATYFYTYRDMRDALASAWRKNRLTSGHRLRTPEALESFIRAQLKAGLIFEARSNLWRGRYEDFVDDLEGLTRQLAAVLKVTPSQELIQRLVADAQPDQQRERVRELSRGNQAIGKTSFITSNHITDGREGAWKETLTVAEAALAERIARRWLKSRGYSLCFRKSQQLSMNSAATNSQPAGLSPAEKAERRKRRRQEHRRTQSECDG